MFLALAGALARCPPVPRALNPFLPAPNSSCPKDGNEIGKGLRERERERLGKGKEKGKGKGKNQDLHDWLQTSPGKAAVLDPLGSNAFSIRLVRGGSMAYGAPTLQAAPRMNNYPKYRNTYHGFRCARTTQP